MGNDNNVKAILNYEAGDVFEFGSFPTNLVKDQNLLDKMGSLKLDQSIFFLDDKKYYLDKDLEDYGKGWQYYEFAPIRWRVIDKNKSSITLITEDIIASNPLTSPMGLPYIQPYIINVAFSKEEKRLLKPSFEDSYGIYLGHLPSQNDVKKYNLANKVPLVTDYGAKYQGSNYVYKPDNPCSFWTTSQMRSGWMAYPMGVCCDNNGCEFIGFDANEALGIRPIIVIDLRKVK